jgi:hypothetical protein
VQRLVDRAADFLDNRLRQALNAFVERHSQVRLVLSRYTRTLVGHIGHSAAGLHGMLKPSSPVLILYESGG